MLNRPFFAGAAMAGMLALAMAGAPGHPEPSDYRRAPRGKSGMTTKAKKPRKFKGSKAAKKANRR